MFDFLKTKKRAEPVDVVINKDFTRELPPGMYDILSFKMSGQYAASGTGVNALDGPFNLLGKIEVVKGNEPVITMHGIDARHFGCLTVGGHAEILPANPVSTVGAPFLAQVDLNLSKLFPQAAIDGRGQAITVRGRFRGLTNLGSTVTSIVSGKARFSGETTAVPNGDHFEPKILAQTIDISTASSDLKGRFVIGSDYECCKGIFLRQFDSSAELTDPNASRTDGLVREFRIVGNFSGVDKELGRWTWGEAKKDNTTKWGVTGATGQISTGVAFVELFDPEATATNGAPVFMQGDTITLYCDTVSTIEDEFTAVTPAAGDLLFWYPINGIMRGPTANLARAQAARDRNLAKRISAARSQALGLEG